MAVPEPHFHTRPAPMTPPPDARRPAYVPFLAGAVVATVVLLVADALKEYVFSGTTSDPAAVVRRQQAAWNRGDLDGFMADYQMADATTMYSGGEIRQGWDTILTRYRKTYQADGATMGELAFDDVDVQLVGPDAAVVRGRWTVKLPDKTPTGLFTLLMKNTAQGWKIVHDHTSAATPKNP
jgi:uncharacterized protein (TIGR02246 family)